MSDGEPLTGEPLALDLVNTRPTGPDGHPADLIDTPRRLAAWLDLEADRLPADLTRTAPSADDLAAVRAVRGHIEATLRAVTEGNAPPPSALRALTEAQRLAPAFRELAWDGAAVTAAPAGPDRWVFASPPFWRNPPPTSSPTPGSARSGSARPRTACCCSCRPTPAAAGARLPAAATAPAWPATTGAISRTP